MAHAKTPTFLILGLLVIALILGNHIIEARTRINVVSKNVRPVDVVEQYKQGHEGIEGGHEQGRKLASFLFNWTAKGAETVQRNGGVGKTIVNGVKSAAKKLNPLNWFS